jgi:serine/threonine protein kinase
MFQALFKKQEDDGEKDGAYVSERASHLDLSKEQKELLHFYDEIAKQPVNQLRFRPFFMARHKERGQYRSIKFMPKKRVPEKFFWGEVQTYKALFHPNVLNLYETLEDEDNYYFIVDRLDRPNIYQAVPKMFPNPQDFDETQVALMVRCILKTLVYCHKNNIALRMRIFW